MGPLPSALTCWLKALRITGCWLEASVLLHGQLTTWHLVFPRVRGERERERGKEGWGGGKEELDQVLPLLHL